MKINSVYSRPRMDSLLSAVTDYSILTVVAGAGYGKTFMADDYFKRCKTLHVKISLTDGNSDVFWDKLCYAMDNYDKKIADALRIVGLPLDSWNISRVVKIIKDNCIKPFILCIDDYYLLPENSPVHNLIDTIAFENIRNFHIMILSRRQPYIRIATLVSKGLALCIDSKAVCFNQKETDGYLSMRGLRLTQSAVKNILETSNGWISAIYLLCEGIRSGGKINTDKEIDTLFEENLMNQLSEIDCNLLYRLSAFTAFTVELAVYSLCSERVRELINYLKSENVFITCDEYNVYRFHSLFYNYLKSNCPDDSIQKNICRRAGLWALTHKDIYWLYPVTMFEKADCIDEMFSILNKPYARRLNYFDLSSICRVAMEQPVADCLVYPLTYLQIVFYLLMSGEKQPIAFALKLMNIMKQHINEIDSTQRNHVSGELIVISRITGYGDYYSDNDALIEASCLLDGKSSELLNPEDPFTFGLPMLLDSEFMSAGELDNTVERCQHNYYELVSDGFGRGSEKLILCEAALLRCEMDNAKHYAIQAIDDAKEKQQYFIIVSAYSVLMRRSLFIGDTKEAYSNLQDICAVIPEAVNTLKEQRITIVMLREVLQLAECFYNSSLRQKRNIPVDFLNGTHKSDMSAGLGVPQIYMARAMYLTNDFIGAERMCDSLNRVPKVCQLAKISGNIISSLCKEYFYGAGSGTELLRTALLEAQLDGIILPFAENPDILPMLSKQNVVNGISTDFINKIIKQAQIYKAIMPKQTISISVLSNREREVLILTANGKSRAETAKLLNVKESTVKTQLSSIYKKLEVKGKVEAIHIASTQGLL